MKLIITIVFIFSWSSPWWLNIAIKPVPELTNPPNWTSSYSSPFQSLSKPAIPKSDFFLFFWLWFFFCIFFLFFLLITTKEPLNPLIHKCNSTNSCSYKTSGTKDIFLRFFTPSFLTTNRISLLSSKMLDRCPGSLLLFLNWCFIFPIIWIHSPRILIRLIFPLRNHIF